MKNATDWLAALLLAAVFAPALVNMSAVWSERDYYSHGYLVPLVSLWALAGLPAAEGVAISIAYGVLILLASLPGAVILLSGR